MTAPPADLAPPDMRRGACPALSSPMQTGDGLLARIALLDAIGPQQLAAICSLAQEHGNGIIDISARGNLQVRGLTGETAGMLDTDVRALKLPLREGLAVDLPPLAGLDPIEIADPRSLAVAIREGARGIEGLAPKMSVVVDGSGQMRLSNLLADIRLLARGTEDGIRWQILLGGTEATARIHGIFDRQAAVAETLALLRKLAGMGTAARGGDLASATMAIGGMPERHSSPFGLVPLKGGKAALGIALVFGQVQARQLAALCAEAERLGISSVRPAFDHSLLFVGDGPACAELAAFAAVSGFITSAADPRASIAACPGSPACTSASIDTHSLADVALEAFGDLFDGSIKLHVTGCPKGCAHPQLASLTLCGIDDAVSLTTGKPSAPAFASMAESQTGSALRILAALVRSERRQDETSAACIARLGESRLALSLTSGSK
ncbi:precorrin-3B synthase [Pseudorhizobium endolithicum]|uniref:Precorrin-3B synthase n=1 Tax=Pseudorhizobium endolithicum TaxID=1191678 RepID=A0ABN7JVG7_9HYPH|nr:precorrin-3B synthase [Pseudorhizobium endolithicum]CAD7050319.1 precorrin-3B synthase [Pseudorhizobium endolithicum]